MHLLLYLTFGLVWAACKGVPDRSPRRFSWVFSLVRYSVSIAFWPLCGLAYALQEAKRSTT